MSPYPIVRGFAARALSALAPFLLAAVAAAAQDTGTLTGRVLDEATLEPVAGVLVRIHDSDTAAVTDADGRFRLEGVPAGRQVVVVAHLAYGEQRRDVLVPAGEETRLDLRLAPRPVELAPVVVEGVTELEQRRISSGHSMNEIHRPVIAEAFSIGLGLGELLDRQMLGVRVREGPSGPHSCVEYRGGVSSEDDLDCREVAVFLDGVPVTMPSALFATMPLTEIERLEILSPGQAGVLYGSEAGRGVLLVETRRGTRPRGPRIAREDLVFGFDADLERRAYPWTRVLGGSLVGNAAGLGVALITADACFRIFRAGQERSVLGVKSRCNGAVTMAAGFVALSLPGFAGGYGARWGGETDRSRGRILPSMVVGTLSAATGYVLLVQGTSKESPASVMAATLILTVGTPALLALTDRTFRILR